MWEVHHLHILNSENCAELWPLYLAYDAEIRRRATQLPIDPLQFSIGIWNDLEARFTAKKVLTIVQSDMKTIINHKNSFNPNIPYTPIPYLQSNHYSWDPLFTSRNPNWTSFHSIQTHPSHSHSNQHNPCKCIFCRDRSGSHTSRNCPTFKLVQHHRHPMPFTSSRTSRHQTKQIWQDILFCMEWTFRLQPRNVSVWTPLHALWFQSPQCPMLRRHLNILLSILPLFQINGKQHLLIHCFFNKFHDVLIGMCHGFDMGIQTSPLYTYTPLNHNLALLHPNHILSHIQNELSLCHYSGPFSKSRLESLIGPFHTSPLGTVPKASTLDEHWIIQDLSFPRHNTAPPPFIPSTIKSTLKSSDVIGVHSMISET